MQQSKDISIITPVYKAEKIVAELVAEIIRSIEQETLNYEIILVEDASPDASWKAIQNACASNSNIKGVRLEKNFGQHAAIQCGLEQCVGDLVFVMDCDLQHQPRDFQKFLESIKRENTDFVVGIHQKRNHSFFKNVIAFIFYKLYGVFIGENQVSFGKELSNFTLLKRNVVDELVLKRRKGAHFLMNLRTIKQNYSVVHIEHSNRFEGNSSYSFIKQYKHGLEGLGVHTHLGSFNMIFVFFAVLCLGGVFMINNFLFIPGVIFSFIGLIMLILVFSVRRFNRILENAEPQHIFRIQEVLN